MRGSCCDCGDLVVIDLVSLYFMDLEKMKKKRRIQRKKDKEKKKETKKRKIKRKKDTLLFIFILNK